MAANPIATIAIHRTPRAVRAHRSSPASRLASASPASGRLTNSEAPATWWMSPEVLTIDLPLSVGNTAHRTRLVHQIANSTVTRPPTRTPATRIPVSISAVPTASTVTATANSWRPSP
nr:hypothetical protein [Actinophytocola xanthii]